MRILSTKCLNTYIIIQVVSGCCLSAFTKLLIKYAKIFQLFNSWVIAGNKVEWNFLHHHFSVSCYVTYNMSIISFSTSHSIYKCCYCHNNLIENIMEINSDDVTNWRLLLLLLSVHVRKCSSLFLVGGINFYFGIASLLTCLLACVLMPKIS